MFPASSGQQPAHHHSTHHLTFIITPSTPSSSSPYPRYHRCHHRRSATHPPTATITPATTPPKVRWVSGHHRGCVGFYDNTTRVYLLLRLNPKRVFVLAATTTHKGAWGVGSNHQPRCVWFIKKARRVHSVWAVTKEKGCVGFGHIYLKGVLGWVAATQKGCSLGGSAARAAYGFYFLRKGCVRFS
ncbi:hypothetical protein Tco_0175526 [Tanacetum coccineum]